MNNGQTKHKIIQVQRGSKVWELLLMIDLAFVSRQKVHALLDRKKEEEFQKDKAHSCKCCVILSPQNPTHFPRTWADVTKDKNRATSYF